MSTTRIAAVAVAAAIGAGTVGVPSAGAMSGWSKSQCSSYVKGFKKRNRHASSKQRAAANKVLKKQGCSQRV